MPSPRPRRQLLLSMSLIALLGLALAAPAWARPGARRPAPAPTPVASPHPIPGELRELLGDSLTALPALGAPLPETPAPYVPSPYVAPGFRVRVVIRTGEHRLFLFDRQGKLIKSFPVGLGRRGLETEPGVKRIIERVADPREAGRFYWHDPRVFGTRLMFLSNYDLATGEEWKNRYEIHGTFQRYSVGQNFSHGCVRMYNEDVEQVFNAVQVGDFVWVQE